MNFRNVIGDFLTHLFGFDQAHPLLFTQFYFWAFFAFVFAGYSLIRKDKTLIRNSWLFASSLFFYYKTCGLYLALLVFVIVYNYFAARWMRRARREGVRRAILILSVAVDLLVLGYYKYAYFFADLVGSVLGTDFLVQDVFTGGSIFLPVGISFFTFQAISYIVDVKRGRIDPVRNFLDFGFYLSFFPQLVAGPIVRASEFIPQLHKPFNLSRRWFGIAVFWIMNGLAKKLILSDYIAVNLCDRVFENPLLYTGFENLAALFCYSLQVYADFSGYTDIATGVAMLMGFYLPKNFNSPYKATNAGQFWKRWHMTLSNWLKDYLYIPLGGNRTTTSGTWICIGSITLIGVFLSGSWIVALCVAAVVAFLVVRALRSPERRKKINSDVNRMNTMLLGGLWHGASWNFMIWGGLNGIGMVIYGFWKNWNVYVRAAVTGGLCAGLYLLTRVAPAPVWNLFFVWMLLTFAGALVRMLHKRSGCKRPFAWLDRAWAVVQTFVFITFTRLFFRSGSNLDPAVANETAWNTAKNMVTQIGGHWDLSLIPAMAWQHRSVLVLFALGMLIHWLPERWKRRYRLAFASLPMVWMAVLVALMVFVMYQFITADLQSFIYFQF